MVFNTQYNFHIAAELFLTDRYPWFFWIKYIKNNRFEIIMRTTKEEIIRILARIKAYGISRLIIQVLDRKSWSLCKRCLFTSQFSSNLASKGMVIKIKSVLIVWIFTSFFLVISIHKKYTRFAKALLNFFSFSLFFLLSSLRRCAIGVLYFLLEIFYYIPTPYFYTL